MKKLYFSLGILLILVTFTSCKKTKVNECIAKVVGDWSGSIRYQSAVGSCDSYTSINVQPGADNDCKVLFTNLPADWCNSSSFQVIGTVSGDSVFIASQPFGLNTISGRGSIYLNQFVLYTENSSGSTTLISASR
jgi:hypothetical protein